MGLAAVLGIDVTARPASMGVNLRLLAISVGVLAVGVIAGFFLPSLGRESNHV
jgi:hypothetical protein